jgi:porphobilinogen synthase
MNFERFHPLRASEAIRDKNADVQLDIKDFILPYFVVEGTKRKETIPSLKGIYRFSVDTLLEDLEKTVAVGIDKILLFGVVEDSVKTLQADYAVSDESIVAKAIQSIRSNFPGLTIMTDICLCAYTSHGHCGILNANGEIENDQTLPFLAKMALAHARAGADVVAPSAMMDGQVLAIRNILDDNGFKRVKVMGYSAKYASGFYGPFRDAAQSAPGEGNRKSYQMDFRTSRQGIDEVTADINEGAAYIMIKPAHTYLDVIARVKDKYPDTTLAAYHTSGEYMMIVAAGEKGLLNKDEAMFEALTAIKRAGAQWLITYYAREFAQKWQK